MITLLDSTLFTTRLELIYLVLACVGLLIVIICIGAYVFGYGVNIRDRVQEISAFGAQLKISVITFLILVGVLMIVPIVWNQFNDVVRSLEAAKEKVKVLERTQTKEQPLLLELEGISGKVDLKKEDFVVLCFRDNESQPQEMPCEIVSLPGKPDRLKVIFKDVNDNTTFPELEVRHANDSMTWRFGLLRPTIPVITLKKAKDE
jgi:hypothetical protein